MFPLGYSAVSGAVQVFGRVRILFDDASAEGDHSREVLNGEHQAVPFVRDAAAFTFSRAQPARPAAGKSFFAAWEKRPALEGESMWRQFLHFGRDAAAFDVLPRGVAFLQLFLEPRLRGSLAHGIRSSTNFLVFRRAEPGADQVSFTRPFRRIWESGAVFRWQI